MPADVLSLPITLDDKQETPLYQQLAARLREAIAHGALTAGAVVPTTRMLAGKLGVSRATVIKAYDILQSQGFIVAQEDGGMIIADGKMEGAAPLPPLPVAFELTEFAARATRAEETALPSQLASFAPSWDELPHAIWKRLLHRQIDEVNLEQPLPAPGSDALREAIAEYLSRTRALQCDRSQVAVFSGPTSSLDFLSRVFIHPDDIIAVENPGFPIARRIFKTHGAALLPIPVDGEGIQVEALCNVKQNIRAVYITPSAQDPTGTVLSPSRREALVAWARENGSLIIEDDFGASFRYTSRPLPSLAGIDAGQCVVYLSSFWEALFPLTRVSFAVFPRSVFEATMRVRDILEREVSAAEQAALTELLNSGQLESHIRKLRNLHAKRRQALIISLTKKFGGRLKLPRESSGTHLLLKFKEPVYDQAAAQIEQTLPMVRTRQYYVGEAPKDEFVLSFSRIADDQVDSIADQLHSILEQS